MSTTAHAHTKTTKISKIWQKHLRNQTNIHLSIDKGNIKKDNILDARLAVADVRLKELRYFTLRTFAMKIFWISCFEIKYFFLACRSSVPWICCACFMLLYAKSLSNHEMNKCGLVLQFHRLDRPKIRRFFYWKSFKYKAFLHLFLFFSFNFIFSYQFCVVSDATILYCIVCCTFFPLRH